MLTETGKWFGIVNVATRNMAIEMLAKMGVMVHKPEEKRDKRRDQGMGMGRGM